ncbi:hypothetical protein Drose_25675 [Dactylosporangium roseum]|uniref:Uncharacterized protein n=1 Tax=Dactylosporangium roseum TaxID=47989 RepID=A0ABY5YXX4_9ACTN|nr:hypothetical protein [Dactylosporangium roseum]UWZ34600.1 hypothetical protein Drose_25675 [Dactylosporangium roseum]
MTIGGAAGGPGTGSVSAMVMVAMNTIVLGGGAVVGVPVMPVVSVARTDMTMDLVGYCAGGHCGVALTPINRAISMHNDPFVRL